jgi:hypothetical protein
MDAIAPWQGNRRKGIAKGKIRETGEANAFLSLS